MFQGHQGPSRTQVPSLMFTLRSLTASLPRRRLSSMLLPALLVPLPSTASLRCPGRGAPRGSQQVSVSRALRLPPSLVARISLLNLLPFTMCIWAQGFPPICRQGGPCWPFSEPPAQLASGTSGSSSSFMEPSGPAPSTPRASHKPRAVGVAVCPRE